MTRDWGPVRLIAHRCGGSLAPENSLAGLDMAAKAGFAAVEFDVMLSADHVAMVIHDETLERTTRGYGRVADLGAVELQRLSCGKGWQGFDQEPIPTLSQVLHRCYALGLLPNIEIKPSQGADELTGERVARQVWTEWAALGGAMSEVLISSFSLPSLVAARSAAPGLARACLFEQIPADWRGQLESVAAVAVHCSASRLSASSAAAVSAAEIALRCYTVNDVDQAASLFLMGVQAIFTDAVREFSVPGKPAGLMLR